MTTGKEMYSDQIVEQAMKKALSTSSALALKSQIFTAVKPVLDQQLHFNTIVDVGCGIGYAAEALTGHYNRYIGIDPSQKIIDAARMLHRKNTKAQFIAQDIQTTDLAENSADVILCFGSFHHMDQLEKSLAAIARIARDGAHLIIVEPHNNSPVGFLYRFIRTLIDPEFVGNQIYYSEDYLIDLITRHGFINQKLHYHGFLSTPFAQTVLTPQVVFAPLSVLTVSLDGLLESFLPRSLIKMAVNLIVIATLKK